MALDGGGGGGEHFGTVASSSRAAPVLALHDHYVPLYYFHIWSYLVVLVRLLLQLARKKRW